MREQRIREIVARRELPYLLHFTRTSNLESIMANGLVPVDEMEARGVCATINDPWRLDRRLSYISTSIAFPNGLMLWKLRNDHPNEDWAILILRLALLWSKPALFCRHNAADARISRVPDEMLARSMTLEGMFDEIEGLSSREEQLLKPCDPTDVQAEVLIRGRIGPENVLGAVFNSTASKNAHEGIFGERPLYVHNGRKGFFATRGYFRLNN